MNSFSSTQQQQQIRSLQKATSNCYSSVENNIVDIKNFYVNYLISILKPSLIDGINGLFEDVIKTKESRNISIQDLKLFKIALKNISIMKDTEKIKMVVQIKDNTKTGETLGDLVKAVFKSYAILLTFNSTGKFVNSLKENFHNKVDVSEFIYRCYLEFSTLIFFNTDIFIKYYNNAFNYSEPINEMVHSAIETAIYKMLPMSDIITNYINNTTSNNQNNDNVLVDIAKYIISKINKNTDTLKQDLLSEIKRITDDYSYNISKNNEEIIDEIRKIKITENSYRNRYFYKEPEIQEMTIEKDTIREKPLNRFSNYFVEKKSFGNISVDKESLSNSKTSKDYKDYLTKTLTEKDSEKLKNSSLNFFKNQQSESISKKDIIEEKPFENVSIGKESLSKTKMSNDYKDSLNKTLTEKDNEKLKIPSLNFFKDQQIETIDKKSITEEKPFDNVSVGKESLNKSKILNDYKDSLTKTITEKNKEKFKKSSLDFLKDQRPISIKSLPVPKNNY